MLVVGGLVLAALEGKPEGTSPVPRRHPGAARDRSTATATATGRRPARTFAEHPLIGIGSGGFQVEWLKVASASTPPATPTRSTSRPPRSWAWSGSALLLLFLGGVGAAVVRAATGSTPARRPGLAAGLAAWAFHAGLDWDWEMPAVTLPALLLAAAAIAWSERRDAAGARREAAA